MGHRLRRHGFEPRFWSYFSIRGSIDTHAQQLIQFVDKQRLTGIHFVGHSMGAIICRRALLELSPEVVHRFVMLAPPNRGSHVATRLSPTLGRICPALVELADTQDSYVRNLGVPRHIETGIVGAERDLVVRRDSLPLGGEVDLVTFPGMHSQLLLRSDAAESVATFLKSGRFRASDCQSV